MVAGLIMGTLALGGALVWISFRMRRRLLSGEGPRAYHKPGNLKLRSFLKPYKWPLLTATGLTMFSTVIALASPWPLKVIVDNAIGGEPLGEWAGPARDLSPSALAGFAALTVVVLVAVSSLIDYLNLNCLARVTGHVMCQRERVEERGVPSVRHFIGLQSELDRFFGIA